MSLAKVIDHPDLRRNIDSKGILNVNQDAFNKYRDERARQLKLNEIISEQASIKNDIHELKDNMNDIKNLLRVLVEKN